MRKSSDAKKPYNLRSQKKSMRKKYIQSKKSKVAKSLKRRPRKETTLTEKTPIPFKDSHHQESESEVLKKMPENQCESQAET